MASCAPWPWRLLLAALLLGLWGSPCRAWKPKKSVAGKSVYFIVTDRFARSGKDADNYEFCDLATAPDPRGPNGGAFCNGTLQGIIDKIDYIKGMGFDCIWITPVVKSMDYTGYFAEDFFQVEPHLGDKATLKRLSDTLHQNDMCLILDIVANHVRPLTVESDIGAKIYLGVETLAQFNETQYFHTYGKLPGTSFKDYVLGGVAQASGSQGSDAVLKEKVALGEVKCGPENPNLTQCNCFPGNSGIACPGSKPKLQVEGWFGQLGDLNQSHPYVKEQLLKYVRYLVSEFNVDAFRLDTAIYMEKEFLTELQRAAGVDIFGETTVNNLSYHAGFQNEILTGLLNFPLFYTLPGSFCQYHLGGHAGDYHLQGAFTPALPDMQNLGEVMKEQQKEGLYEDLDLLANFADNHDEFARLTHYCDADSSRIKNMLAWVFLARGTPVIYYGTEQGLRGHQRNVMEKAALKKDGKKDKGQAYVRESLWQTRYATDTWQYMFIRQLNDIRKKYHLDSGPQKIYLSGNSQLIFSRSPTATPDDEVWVFLNNKQNWSIGSPLLYCEVPDYKNYAWVDAISGYTADFTNGCFVARDAAPKILVRHPFSEIMTPLQEVSTPLGSGMMLLGLLALLVTNVVTCCLLFRRRRKARPADSDSSDSDAPLKC